MSTRLVEAARALIAEWNRAPSIDFSDRERELIAATAAEQDQEMCSSEVTHPADWSDDKPGCTCIGGKCLVHDRCVCGAWGEYVNWPKPGPWCKACADRVLRSADDPIADDPIQDAARWLREHAALTGFSSYDGQMRALAVRLERCREKDSNWRAETQRQLDAKSEEIGRLLEELIALRAVVEASDLTVVGRRPDGSVSTLPQHAEDAIADAAKLCSSIDALAERDWTVDPATGHCNASPDYERIVKEVARLIRGQAHSLLAGETEGSARLIVSQLAHVHGLTLRRKRTSPVVVTIGTPGPWGLRGVQIRADGGKGKHVATYQIDRADGLLIAEAPTMYETLKRIASNEYRHEASCASRRQMPEPCDCDLAAWASAHSSADSQKGAGSQ